MSCDGPTKIRTREGNPLTRANRSTSTLQWPEGKWKGVPSNMLNCWWLIIRFEVMANQSDSESPPAILLARVTHSIMACLRTVAFQRKTCAPFSFLSGLFLPYSALKVNLIARAPTDSWKNGTPFSELDLLEKKWNVPEWCEHSIPHHVLWDWESWDISRNWQILNRTSLNKFILTLRSLKYILLGLKKLM